MILEKVKDILVEELGVEGEKVVPEAKVIDDLGADSLAIVEMVMAFEEAFDIEIPEEDTAKLMTVGDIVNYIEENKN